MNIVNKIISGILRVGLISAMGVGFGLSIVFIADERIPLILRILTAALSALVFANGYREGGADTGEKDAE